MNEITEETSKLYCVWFPKEVDDRTFRKFSEKFSERLPKAVVKKVNDIIYKQFQKEFSKNFGKNFRGCYRKNVPNELLIELPKEPLKKVSDELPKE